MARKGVVWVWAALLPSMVMPARAQDPPDPSKRFNDGLELARTRRYAEAVEIWLELAGELSPDFAPRLHKALGLAYRKLGKAPEAWHHLALSTKAAKTPDKQTAEWLGEVETELAKGARRVRLLCAEPDTAFVPPPGDAGRQYPCPLDWWLGPGTLQIGVVTPAGKRLVSVAVPGPPGAQVAKLSVGPRAEPLPPAVPPAEPPAIREPAAGASSGWIAGWTLVGTGAALVACGAFLHGLAYARNESLFERYGDPTAVSAGVDPRAEYDARYDEEVLPKAVATYVMYGVGAAAAVSGIVLLAVRPGEGEAEAASWGIRPLLAVPGASLDVEL